MLESPANNPRWKIRFINPECEPQIQEGWIPSDVLRRQEEARRVRRNSDGSLCSSEGMNKTIYLCLGFDECFGSYSAIKRLIVLKLIICLVLERIFKHNTSPFWADCKEHRNKSKLLCEPVVISPSKVMYFKIANYSE